jgi:hypothetical protein
VEAVTYPSVTPPIEDACPKVARARLIIEFTDGSARHFEARAPAEAEIKLLTVDDLTEQRYGYRPDPPFFPADYTTRLLPALGDRFGGVILRLACHPNGLEPAAHLRIEEESGELPPELAERVVVAIDGALPPEGALLEIRPFLARIAGMR